MTTRKQTPSMTVGPWFSYGLTPEAYGRTGLATGAMAQPGIEGARVSLTGRVFDGTGKPVPDAMLEIWQANAHGRYAHAADTRAAVPAQRGFAGFGRVSTDPEGRFAFSTIKPGRVPAQGAGRGNIMQAPHLNLTVFARGLLSHLFTRIYFSDELAANAEDPVLAMVEPARRGTLIAQRAGSGDAFALDFHLQGDAETVFFEV
jgi:protocatechuate 3,4-dioxygenase, alpha subunit